MTDHSKASRVVTVCNEAGLHLRAASLFVNLARKFESRIEVLKDCERADAKSMPLQLTALGAGRGDELLIEAVGPDSEAALDALAALVADKFHEDQEEDNEQAED